MQSRRQHVDRERGCTPWTCPDQGVRDDWQNLSHPRNAVVLEGLFYQLADGQQLEIVRQALRLCRDRRNRKK